MHIITRNNLEEPIIKDQHIDLNKEDDLMILLEYINRLD